MPPNEPVQEIHEAAVDPASLEHLHDIIVPPPVSMWPPAPGWYVIGAVLLVLLAILVVRVVSRWHANAYRRIALRELEKIKSRATDRARRSLEQNRCRG